MRNLHPDLQSEAAKDENQPIELYEVYLDEATLYFATHNRTLTFLGREWVPLGLSRSPIRTNIESQVDECTVTLDNVTRELSAMIAHTEFRGRRMVIRKTFVPLVPQGYSVVLFDGIMDAPVINQSRFQVTVRSRMDTLEVQLPRRTYRKLCNWKFGSPECGVDLASVTVTGTVMAISGTTLTLSGRSEASGWFEDGILTIGNEGRLVIASNGNQITVDHIFEHAKVGDAYTLRRGCNKSYDESCVPRFGNGANFGGFLSVPTRERANL